MEEAGGGGGGTGRQLGRHRGQGDLSAGPPGWGNRPAEDQRGTGRVRSHRNMKIQAQGTLGVGWESGQWPWRWWEVVGGMWGQTISQGLVWGGLKN